MDRLTISKTNSSIIKIIAITMVVIEHVARRWWGMGEQTANLFGTGGVGIFLFLSGYGLYQSYRKKGITLDYWQRKLWKIFIPYWVVTLIYALLVQRQTDPVILLKNIAMVDFERNIDGTMWYMSILLFEYIAFFLIFLIGFIPDWIKLIALFAFSWLLAGACWFGALNWQFAQNGYSFFIGVLVAWLLERMRNVPAGAVRTTCIGVLGIACVVGYIMGAIKTIPLQYMTFLLIGVVLSVSWLINPTVHNKKLLMTLAALTYPIYLVEGKIHDVVVNFGWEGALLNTACFAVLTLVTSCVLYVFVLLITPHKKARVNSKNQ